jgi:hypothetical protein
MAVPIVILMICSEQWPQSMPPSQDDVHSVIGDFTLITLSIFNNGLHLVQATRVELDREVSDSKMVEIWKTLSFWMFLLSVFFYTSFDFSPAKMASTWVFSTSRDLSSGDGDSLDALYAESLH